MLATIHKYPRQEGRDPATFGVDYHILMEDKSPDELWQEVQTLQAMGVNHICVYTMGQQRTPHEHIEAIRQFREILSS